ncbi:MAG: A/G-specific adenine glycosylase [Chloroflexota bacterium]|nr:A/G-specific adenine glycosylase [Chloroflexota bacterium]MDE3194325.1 A/G-specific adenine glycosylase [Chloroflexota bacterium]
MLQQTPVARVLPAYERFLGRFPTLAALRRARLGDVLVAWGGLGYPRRARDLHRVARSVRSLPRDPAALDLLPGIGRYTASAVACFTWGAPVAFADTNIRRVLGRVVLGRTATEREAIAIDADLMARRRADTWHHALMDLGATICVSRAPRCDRCPLFDPCVAKGRDAAPAVRRQAAFATSDRRVRGAIMRTLRERGPLAVDQLLARVADARAPRLLEALRSEGLLVVRRGRAALP